MGQKSENAHSCTKEATLLCAFGTMGIQDPAEKVVVFFWEFSGNFRFIFVKISACGALLVLSHPREGCGF